MIKQPFRKTSVKSRQSWAVARRPVLDAWPRGVARGVGSLLHYWIDVETKPGAFTEFIITLPRGDGNAIGPKSE